MRSIAMVSEKGGCGKSTTVLNVAACMAAGGLRVLVVDTDPQANSSYVLLRGEKPRRPALQEVLVAEAEARAAIVPSPSFAGVDLLPADPTPGGRHRHRWRTRSGGSGGSAWRWRGSGMLTTSSWWTRPPRGPCITTNVLNFAEEVLVPIAPGLFGVLGLGQLQADVAQVRRFLDNKALRIGGIFLTMVEKNNVARDLGGPAPPALRGARLPGQDPAVREARGGPLPARVHPDLRPQERRGRRPTRHSRRRSSMAEKKTGLTVPAGILQPTMPPEDPPAEEGQGAAPRDEGQDVQGGPEGRPGRTRCGQGQLRQGRGSEALPARGPPLPPPDAGLPAGSEALRGARWRSWTRPSPSGT